MNETCFQIVPLINPSFCQKIFKQQPEENAVIELNNLLATKAINEIDSFDISYISKKYTVNILKEYVKNLYEFYLTYLHFCLIDNKITDDENFNLVKLCKIFQLNEKKLADIQQSILSEIYKKNFQEIISDGKIEDTEKVFITNLQTDLRISDEFAKKVSDEFAGNYLNQRITEMLSDERISPDEEFELQSLTSNLGIKVTDEKTKGLLTKYKQLWLIENSDLKEIVIEEELQKGEKCFYKTTADWYEQRGSSKSSFKSDKINLSDWKFICKGSLYLTNKRIVLTSIAGAKNIRYSGIVCQTLYNQGIEISKDAGKNAFLQINNEPNICSIILKKLLQTN